MVVGSLPSVRGLQDTSLVHDGSTWLLSRLSSIGNVSLPQLRSRTMSRPSYICAGDVIFCWIIADSLFENSPRLNFKLEFWSNCYSVSLLWSALFRYLLDRYSANFHIPWSQTRHSPNAVLVILRMLFRRLFDFKVVSSGEFLTEYTSISSTL